MSYDFDNTNIRYDSIASLYSGTISCTASPVITTTTRSLKAIIDMSNAVSGNATLRNNRTILNCVNIDLSNAQHAFHHLITKSANNAGNLNTLYDNVKARQNDLDKKLATNNKLSDSLYGEMQSHYESTLMAGVLWGTLAGTMIYYVFYK